MIKRYRDQVELLLKVLPIVAKEDVFALKGGTAINFFWRNFPRLSVDIDITYLPIKSREESLNEIGSSVKRIAKSIEERLYEVNVNPQSSGGTVSKLNVRRDNAQVKLEVNTVLRGSVFEAAEKELSNELQKEFELYAAVKSLSLEDLYGGKLCAALDRQHPRDLFDVKLLLENEGITDKIRTAFICYLISHSRPMNELLNPNKIPLEDIYQNEFDGMTVNPVSLEDLKAVQESLPEILLSSLTNNDKDFLNSFKSGEPDWSLMQVPHLKELPGVQWKLLNIRKMDSQKHEEMREKLEKVLNKSA